ncbi:MAG: hypothetical protein BMS9Abin15_0929 [Gammaproteobacteria bacterium]|nr:MAG: hypothetical protein BMS9Abin15_0929 [Gammaproteobacteria bacterium]
MQTRCPHCETVFRITDEQLTAAAGLVRCGQCSRDFYARRYLIRHGSYKLGNQTPDLSQPSAPESLRKATSKIDQDEVQTQISPDLPPALAETWQAPDSPKRGMSRFLWGTLAMLGILAAVTQGAWIYRTDLYAQASLQPWMERLCKKMDCRLPSQPAPVRIDLLSRDVRAHPTIHGALLVTATLINRGSDRIRWPMIELSLSDLTGRVIALRRFKPDEYLSTEIGRTKGLAPDVPTTIIMELADPGVDTVSYRFEFI